MVSPSLVLADHAEPHPGAMVTDNVRLVRRLAEGGMGSVWLAHHVGLDHPVAVKFMTASAFRDTPAALERFTREARAAAQIRHPNVVLVHDVGCSMLAGGTPYIVMEYLEGIDLEHHIAQHGWLELQEAISIVLTVAGVLEKAHEVGIVHRDIKPENVFLQGCERVVKVLDFGVARDEKELSERTTAAGEMIGTPYFMSPEQFLNPKEVDYRCDLWALGVLAYEVLVARMPFRGDSPTGIFLQAMHGTFEKPSALRPDLPPALDGWFHTAFATDRARRFSSARAMADALVQAAFGTPAAADFHGAHAGERRRLRGGARRWALSAALVSAALMASAYFGRTLVLQTSDAAEERVPARLGDLREPVACAISGHALALASDALTSPDAQVPAVAQSASLTTAERDDACTPPTVQRATSTRTAPRARPMRRVSRHGATSFFFVQ
ncbi:MAG TPA: serine/threonine-protein kinase [Polyangiaceae bacterium]|nr:serine/threonine-protein kinase [Polyangiaceae bacterium]